MVSRLPLKDLSEVFRAMPLRKFIAVLLVLFPGLCFGKSDGITESQSALTVREHRVWATTKTRN